MRDMELSANGRGQRVYRADGRVGEGHPGQHGALQHRATRLQIAAVFDRRNDMIGEQPERAHGERIGEHVLGMTAGVRFDGVHHRIDTGHCRHTRRKPKGERGVEHRDVGIQTS